MAQRSWALPMKPQTCTIGCSWKVGHSPARSRPTNKTPGEVFLLTMALIGLCILFLGQILWRSIISFSGSSCQSRGSSLIFKMLGAKRLSQWRTCRTTSCSGKQCSWDSIWASWSTISTATCKLMFSKPCTHNLEKALRHPPTLKMSADSTISTFNFLSNNVS